MITLHEKRELLNDIYNKISNEIERLNEFRQDENKDVKFGVHKGIQSLIRLRGFVSKLNIMCSMWKNT